MYLLNQLSSNLDRWEALTQSNITQVAFQVVITFTFILPITWVKLHSRFTSLSSLLSLFTWMINRVEWKKWKLQLSKISGSFWTTLPQWVQNSWRNWNPTIFHLRNWAYSSFTIEHHWEFQWGNIKIRYEHVRVVKCSELTVVT